MIKGIEGAELSHMGMIPPELMHLNSQNALRSLYNQLGPLSEQGLGKAMIDYVRSVGMGGNKTDEVIKARALLEKSVVRPANKVAARVRDLERSLRDPQWESGDEVAMKAFAKATLDVGTLTNFANVTGGQALGYVSLDTRMARGTVRPSSFTLYQALDKSLAWQVVDFWALAKATGGAPPGAAFANYSSVSSGSLATSAGT